MLCGWPLIPGGEIMVKIRKILAVLLSAAMAFSYLPGRESIAVADEGEVIEWTEADALPANSADSTGKTFRLMTDVTLSETKLWSGKGVGNITIDLNGHTIENTGELLNNAGVFHLEGTVTVTVKDSSTEGTGRLVGPDSQRYVVRIYGANGATFNLDGGSISGNTVQSGAVFVEKEDGVFNLCGGSISGNTASSNGGGVNINEGTFNMTSGVISGNTAANGGGVFCTGGGRFDITGGVISGNTAANGGGVYSQGSASSGNIGSGVIVRDNTSTAGGAGAFLATGTYTLAADFISNEAGSNGGAIYSGSKAAGATTSVTITGGTYSENTADKIGGAIYAYIPTALSVSDAAFTANSAGTRCGGVWIESDLDASFTRVTMTGNTTSGTVNGETGAVTDGEGAAILHNNRTGSIELNDQSTLALNGDGTLTLKDVTITGNTSGASGKQAVYYFTGSLVLEGCCVIRNNTSGGADADVTVRSGNTVTIGAAGLDPGSDIGLRLAAKPALGDTVVTGASEGDEEYFTITNHTDRTLVFSSGSLVAAEHTYGGITYNALLPGESFPTKGNWYLTEDITLSGRTNLTGTLNIDLNGHTISVADSDEYGLIRTRNSEYELNITSSRPGAEIKVVSGSGAVFFSSGSDAVTESFSNFTVSGYDGDGQLMTFQGDSNVTFTNVTFSGNTSSSYNGLFYVSGAEVTLENCTVENNSSTWDKASVVVENEGTSTTTVYATPGFLTAHGTAAVNVNGGTFSGNSSLVGGGVFSTISSGAALNVNGASFTGNTTEAASGGSAIHVRYGSANVTDSVFTGNTATAGNGALYINNTTSASASVDGSSFTGNTGKAASAVYTGTNGIVSIKDSTVTGNSTADSGRYTGAVYSLSNDTTLEGGNVIKDNVNGAGDPADFTMQNPTSAGSTVTKTFIIKNPTDAADVNVKYANYRESCNGVIGTVEGEMAGTWTWLANTEYSLVKSGNGKLIVGNHVHDGVSFMPWTETGLPDEGNWYLTEDIEVTERVIIAAGSELNLCLNGHNLTVPDGTAAKFFVVNGTLSIYDDTETPGAISGGKANYGGAISVQRGAVFNLYGGVISGNFASGGANNQGGAIYVQGGSETALGGVVNMYGGELRGNSAATIGGAIATGDSNDASQYEPAYVNIYGGKISGNTADSNGGAIYAGKYTRVYTGEAVFEGNTTAANGGAIYIPTGASVVCEGTVFTGNSGKNSSAVYLVGSGFLTLENCTVTDNTVSITSDYSGAIYAVAGGLTLKGRNTIKDNTRGDGAPANVLIQNDTGMIALEDISEDSYVGIKTYDQRKSNGGAIGTITGSFAGTWVWDKNTSFEVDVIGDTVYALKPLSDGATAPTSGYYYLTEDYTFSGSSVTLAGDLTLCLHGHDVILGAATGNWLRTATSTITIGNSLDTGGFTTVSGITRGENTWIVGGASSSSGTIRLYNVNFHDIRSSAAGTIISLQGATNLYAYDCRFTNNTNSKASSIYLNSTGEAVFDNCTATGNKASNGLFYINSSSPVLFRDCTIKDNSTTGTGSILRVTNQSVAVFEGTNVVVNNSNKDGEPANIILDADARINVKNDTEGTLLSLNSAADMTEIGSLTEGEFLGTYLWTSDLAKAIVLGDSGSLVLEGRTYENIVYGAKTYAPWMSITSLPSASPAEEGVDGYYLIGDVVATSTTDVSGSLDLLLNGHDIRFIIEKKNGVFRVPGSGQLNIDNNLDAGGFNGAGSNAQSLLFTGADSAEGGSITVTDVRFYNYTGIDASSHAIVLQGGANAEFHGCTFENLSNTETSSAAIYRTGTGSVTIDNCTFADISSGTGGAVYIGGSANGYINDSSFTGTTSGTIGSALNIAGSANVTVVNNTFEGTSAGTSGGAVSVSGKAGAEITGNTFANTTAQSNGGALYLAGTGVRMVGANIFDGASAVNGGAIYIAATSSATVADNTFTSCIALGSEEATAEGGAIYAAGSSSALKFGNIEIAGNTFTGTGNEAAQIAVGRRAAAVISGIQNAAELTLPDGTPFISGMERSCIIMRGVEMALTGADAVRTYGTIELEDTLIPAGSAVTVDASYNMWMIQMDALAVVRGNTIADIVLTQNDGSWYAGNGGEPEKAILSIQGENLGADARIALTIPSGGSVSDFVFGPANIEDSGTDYVITQGVVLPGYEPAAGGNDYSYDITSVQLVVGEDLALKYYVKTDDPYASVAFFVDGTETTNVEYDPAESTYSVLGLSPRDMMADVSIVLRDGSGSEQKSVNDFSVIDYIDSLYESVSNMNTESANSLKMLLAYLVRFGADSQLYTNHNTGSLPTDGRAWIDGFVRTDAKPADATVISGTASDVKIKSANIQLSDQTKIYFNVQADESAQALLTYSDDGGSTWTTAMSGTLGTLVQASDEGFAVSDLGGGIYRIYTAGLMGTQFGRLYKLTVTGSDGERSVQYSVNSYVSRKWNASNETIKILVRDMYYFGLAANDYRSAQ